MGNRKTCRRKPYTARSSRERMVPAASVSFRFFLCLPAPDIPGMPESTVFFESFRLAADNMKSVLYVWTIYGGNALREKTPCLCDFSLAFPHISFVWFFRHTTPHLPAAELAERQMGCCSFSERREFYALLLTLFGTLFIIQIKIQMDLRRMIPEGPGSVKAPGLFHALVHGV